MSDDQKTDEAKANEDQAAQEQAQAKQDDVVDGAPDPEASAKKVNDLQKKITDLQNDLARAEIDDQYAQAARNLVNLRKAHDDAEGDPEHQKVLQQQIDQHEPIVRTQRAMAKRAADSAAAADKTPKATTADEG